MSLMSMIRSATQGELPTPPTRYSRDDRFEVTNVRAVDGAVLERRWTAQTLRSVPMEEPALDRVLQRVRSLEARLARNGGAVVWVRMPTSGSVLEAEERLYPRARTFDRIGSTRWHYADHEETRDLSCFDGSHLAPTSAEILSRTLGRWLKAGPFNERFGHRND